MTTLYYLCDLEQKIALSVMPKPSTFANRITGMEEWSDDHLADLAPFDVPGYGFLRVGALADAGISQASIKACNAVMSLEMSDAIDAAVAARCAPPQRFIAEYQERESQARMYTNDYDANPARGDSIPVPVRIAAFAASAGIKPIDAALLTVKQADALRLALGELADLRMRKYEIMRAASAEDSHALYGEILAAIEAVAIP